MATATSITRPGAHRLALAGPIAVAALGCGAALVVATVDPEQSSAYPACPLQQLTGLYCPACGMTRAASRLLHGDVLRSLGANLLFPLVIALAATAWWSWLGSARGRPARWWFARFPGSAWVLGGVAVLGYSVLRNTGVEPFAALAP